MKRHADVPYKCPSLEMTPRDLKTFDLLNLRIYVLSTQMSIMRPEVVMLSVFLARRPND